MRLIHALVRHALQHDRRAWNAAWGTPINQEDLLGTLLAFSVAVLHGLRRMGARIPTAAAEDYVFAWTQIGRLLGIRSEILPRSEAQAVELALEIGRRQHRPTAEGAELALELLGAVESLFPIPGYALSLSHFFLADTVFGANVASVLQLPRPNWTRWLVQLRAAHKRTVLGLLPHVPGATIRRSFLARRFVQRLVLLERPDGRAVFQVPDRFY